MPTAMQPNISDSYNVFVYGTLKRGQVNHNCLGGSTFLGRRRLIGGQLHDRGRYPMALLCGRSGVVIHGELFRVSDCPASTPLADSRQPSWPVRAPRLSPATTWGRRHEK